MCSVVPLNCSEKCYEKNLSNYRSFSLGVTSVSCLPLPIQIFFFYFFACYNFWPFFAYIYFWLESWGIIHLISLCHLNFLMLLEFNISSNTVMRCYSVMQMIFPSASQTYKFFYIVSRYLLIRSCTVQEVYK